MPADALTFLQRMAAAIAAEPGEDLETVWLRLKGLGEADWYLGKARQVLAAMGVPTEAMIEAHFQAHAAAPTIFADVRDMWRAMLTAAAARDQAPAIRRRGDGVMMADIGGVQR